MMKATRHLYSPPRPWLWLWVTLLSAVTQVAYADRLKEDQYYKVTEHTDHVSFEILIADGYSTDTWCEWGSIRAYSEDGRKGIVYHIMDVETDHHDDDSENWEFYAQTKMDGSRAWLTNTSTSVEKEITQSHGTEWKDRASNVRYIMYKGKDNLYPTVKIDFYYGPEMAGKKWYFYYEYKHNKGSSHNMSMGSAYCSDRMGLASFSTSDFSYSREAGNKIKFTVPALPDDVPAKLKANRWHEGTYKVTFYYTLQDGSSKKIEERFECQLKSPKTYEITIPKEIGNFKKLDISVMTSDRLKCENGLSFYEMLRGYGKSNIFPYVPVPFGLTAEYLQFDNKADLSWNAFPTGDNNYIQESIPYVYRIETDKNGNPLSGQTWNKRTSLNVIDGQQSQGYTDANVSANKYYKYMVVNVPKAWIDNRTLQTSDLNSPSNELLNTLGYTESDIMETAPNVSIYNLQQDTTVTDKVRFQWEYSRIPVSTKNASFQVMRREKGKLEWTNYGTVECPANPTADKAVSFTDNTLPNFRSTYQYKVVLAINNGVNTFESDVLTAGLLSGTVVRTVSATKGTHENVVRVSWTVKHVGTDNTNYEVFRRYAGTTDEYLKVYSVSGHSDSYTYEDNTVQPGYFYEYKVDAYSGDKESSADNTYQNTLSDVGFSQARGVISGKVAFGSGNAVDNVRLSLRSNVSDDGNVVRGYSQRVDGVSTGIRWDVDSTETVKLFGDDKDYTVQMFVRPDDDLAEGVVVGEIPAVGRLLLGSKNEEGYKLLLEKYGDATIQQGIYNTVRELTVALWRPDEECPAQKYFDENLGETVYCLSYYQGGIESSLKNRGYKRVNSSYIYVNRWSNNPYVVRMELYTKDVPLENNVFLNETKWEGTCYDTGLTLSPSYFTLLSLQHDSNGLTIAVNDSVSATLSSLYTKAHQKNETIGDFSKIQDTELVQGVLLCRFVNIYQDNCKKLIENYESSTWVRANNDVSVETKPLVMPFSVGGSYDIQEEEAFNGYLTEVRVWNHVLTQKERDSYVDRVLNGREAGLKLYWPMDEGISHFVFDASYTNDLPNGRHATVGNNIISSTTVPTDAQLSRYGLTNELGEFTIRGIPFVGSGTTYTVIPSKGIHVFSPISRSGFIGNGSLALNNYDFTDQSSFPMRGKVTYLNTNIPADSIQFKVDGTLLQSKEGLVMTDANGEYEISVPIGKHLIEAWKDGHRLTSFPLDGSTYDFKQEEIVNFFDSTLVNVTGRINGGFTDRDEPLGFGRSVNRIGKAVVKLSLGKESQCSFNYIVDDHGDGKFGTTNLPVESATDQIKSTAYRAGGSHDETHYIYITTDEKTGEFSAMIPPLRYKVESIKFVGGKDYDDEPVFSQNLPFIDATNTMEKVMLKDTLTVDGVTQEYIYCAKMNRQLRKEPTITVQQVDAKNGAFGEERIAVSNTTEKPDTVVAITYTDKGYKYEFGHPLFVQEGVYEFGIDVSEDYVNLDTKEEFHEIPKDAMVTIINDASSMTTVIAEKAIINGEEAQIGEAYETPSINVTPDEKGHVSYQFVGGWPNLAQGNLRNMSIGVKVDGRTTMWQAPNSETNALDMILLGAITSGTNFMTEGPDKVDMILRRPPGSTSEAVYTSEKITSYMTTKVSTKNGRGSGGGANVLPQPVFKTQYGEVMPVTGITLLFENKLKIVAETQHTCDRKWWDTENFEDEYTYKVTNEIHGTTEGIQNNGDTYIGRSTNLLFGKGWNLGIYKQLDGTYQIQAQEGITVSESFGTYFAYSQEYIEETLIPNWEAFIRSRLETINGNHWEDGNHPRVEGKVKYYTKYKEGDPEWGLSNGDSHWTTAQFDEAKGRPSYWMESGFDEKPNDEVEFAINQIKNWKHIIAVNEEDKLEAFEDKSCFIDNYSIAGGTSISQTTTNEERHLRSYESSYDYAYNTENKIGFLFNEMGAYGIITGTRFSGNSDKNDTTTVASTSIAWTLSDADPRTALSVDVFKSKMRFGPIFRTRGGQTANPYEDATYTKYYNKGTKLDEATMRVELPQLRVKGSSVLSNVPTGGEAKFELELSNRSETNSNCTYILEAIESSNARGAVLSIDGAPLSIGKTGRAISLNGSETISKMLYVSQSDRSITKFQDLKLVLRSEKDESTCSDTLHLEIEFVPSAGLVDMSVAHTVLNLEDLETYKGFQVKFTNLDRQDAGLKGVRVQYRRKGFDSWNLAHQWRVKEDDLEQGDELLPKGNSFECSVSFPSDGTYELRGQTFGTYGNSEVTYETPIIEVTQDTRGPKVLGMPSHDNGTLKYQDRGNMYVRFNEPFNPNAISKSDNFRIDGYLNNVSENKLYTDVALQLNGNELRTQSTFTMTDDDLALGFWFYRKSDGNIVNLGVGEEVLSLYTHDGGVLGVRSGNNEVVENENVTLPENQWNYIALTYKRSTTTDPDNRLTMLFANTEADRPTYLAKDVAAPDLDGNVRLGIGGDGMKGRMHELTLWNIDKSALELYETREEKKANYTPGLIGYWRMNEGRGTMVTDNVRSRHFQMPTESWYINNRNLAAHLDGKEPLKLDIATFTPRQSDNYAIEMWFRGDKVDDNQNAQLLSILNAFSIGFSEGKLVLEKSTRSVSNDNVETKTVSERIVLSDSSYVDNNWHHLALNVHRGTSAIAYIDGQAVKTLAESIFPGLSTKYAYVGGEQTLVAPDGTSQGGSVNHFVGDIDEIRFWGTALTGSLIDERRYERMEEGLYSLYGYFPMEVIKRDEFGHVQATFSTNNFGYNQSQMKMEANATPSENAPALLPGSSRLRLDDNQFDFTVSEDMIYFSFKDDVLPLMDGNEFVIRVENLKDEHGNNSEAVEWKFKCDFALIEIFGDENVEKLWSETKTLPVYLNNSVSSMTTTYELSGMPLWLKVDEPIGNLSDFKTVNFTILPSVPVGRYTDYIYVTDRLGITRSARVNLTVKGDEPDWTVNPDLYESNMTLTGQIYVSDKICQNTDTKIAAFDADDNCRGVAQPHYVESRDAYYVDMIIYGASATEISSGLRYLSFRLYDASSGITYPVVYFALPGDSVNDTALTYAPDANYGSYDKPVKFYASDDISQSKTLARGWTWMSMYVNPWSTDINEVLAFTRNERKKYLNIKSKTAIAAPEKDFSSFVGSLTTFEPGNMYKVQVSTSTNMTLYGTFIDVEKTPQTIYPGYNWIGSLSNSVLSLEDAFADLQPLKDDMVKTRNAMAVYNGQGIWEGTLKNLVPGVGYIYLSKDSKIKTFHYPKYDYGAYAFAPRLNAVDNEDNQEKALYYQPVDDHLFPDNMNIIAVVQLDGENIEDAEVGAFLNGECRGAVNCINGYYFLTIMGSSADDLNQDVEIRVHKDGKDYVVTSMEFISDAVYGTLENPYVLDLNATGIKNVNFDDEDDTEWYTIEGFKIGRRPTKQGVYIHHGKKVTVKSTKGDSN